MKITDTPAVAVAAVSTRAAQTPEPEPKEVADKVSMGTPQQEATIQGARATVDATRQVRIQEIVSAVRSGQYYPSPQQIAQKLVNEAEVEARVRAMLAG